MLLDCDWVDKLKAQRILGIREAQLRNDTALLNELETPGFDYIRYCDKGYGRKSMEALIEFRKLVRTRGRNRAIREINQHMEKYWNEREGQRSGKSC